MSKVKQLADELYNQKVLNGWKNVSMETCLKRASDYYRNKQTKTKKMNKIEYALKLAKDCTFADVMTEGAKEVLRMKIDEALEELNQNKEDDTRNI